MQFLDKIFKINKLNASVSTECLAGFINFIAIAYIAILNPRILEAFGMPFRPLITATILAMGFGSILMGLVANRPFALAPLIGENAFFGYVIIQHLGFSWQQGLALIVISNIIFILLVLANFHHKINDAFSKTFKQSFIVGIGFFLIIIGFTSSGILAITKHSGAPILGLAKLGNAKVILALISICLSAVLYTKKIKGAFLLNILIIYAAALCFGITKIPHVVISEPVSIGPIFAKLSLAGLITAKSLVAIFFLVMIFSIDTIGSIISVANTGKFLDENLNLPHAKKPLIATTTASIFGAICGTSTTGILLESSTGISSGGKTGLTSVITGLLIFLCLFYTPILYSLPPCAYCGPLVTVGLIMVSELKDINFNQNEEFFPAIIMIISMLFSFNIGIGICVGFVIFPIFKIISGKFRQLTSIEIILFVAALIFLISYPY